MTWQLQITLPDQSTYPWQHKGSLVRIGRNPDCELFFTGPNLAMVSWEHAQLEQRPEGIYLQDLGSSNGTMVNGQRIQGRTPVKLGDEISLGASGPRLILVPAASGPTKGQQPARLESRGQGATADRDMAGKASPAMVASALPEVSARANLPGNDFSCPPARSRPFDSRRSRSSLALLLAGGLVGGCLLLGLVVSLLQGNRADNQDGPTASSAIAPPEKKLVSGTPQKVDMPSKPVPTPPSAKVPEPKPPAVKSKDPPVEKIPPPLAAGPTISSIDQEKDIVQALGFVVCGFRLRRQGDGQHFEEPDATGSCFAVTAQGHLLTNKHVVERTVENLRKGERQQVTLDGTRYDLYPTIWVFFGKSQHQARILYVSDQHDFAILKVDRWREPFFALASEQEFPRGRPVFAGGFPAAANVPLTKEEKDKRPLLPFLQKPKLRPRIGACFPEREFEFVLTNGIISRMVTDETGRRWIQHSAPVNPGNSGGPLALQEGTVVGINTLAQRGAAGIFFSLPAALFRDEINRHCPGAVWR